MILFNEKLKIYYMMILFNEKLKISRIDVFILKR